MFRGGPVGRLGRNHPASGLHSGPGPRFDYWSGLGCGRGLVWCGAVTGTADVRIASERLDEHFLATHRPADADQAVYSVADAMADYWVEHGQHQSSSTAIKARLRLFSRFMDVEAEAGRLVDPFVPEHLDGRVLDRFRSWGLADPIVARRKDGSGNWVDGQRRARSASTVEESVIALKAALNSAFASRRTRYVPPIQHKARDQVTPQRTYRLSINAIGELLDYSMRGAGNYAGHADRLLPLRRYLIAGICTLARPDAILDMSVAAERGQWMRDERLFALNQAGRLQTKKVRPVMPVADLLHSWLENTDEWFVCRETTALDPKQKIEVTTQHGVDGIRSAWTGARKHLGIPAGWGPKLLRHSMATILANRRVDLIELEMALGHRVLGKTSSRYATFGPDYLGSVKMGIDDVVSDLTRMAGPALHAKVTQNHSNVAVLRA